MPTEFNQAVARAKTLNPKYPQAAYVLVRKTLDFVLTELKNRDGVIRHVTGSEICDGFRRFMLQEYGPMTDVVVEDAALSTTRDIGEVVFLLIQTGIFTKDPNDRLEDFDDRFDFGTAFSEPFEPKEAAASR